MLGELGLASLLEQDLLDPHGPQRAGDGDAYVTVQDGDRTCTSVRVRVDARGRDVLVDALRAWADAQQDAEVDGRDRAGLVLRSCTS